MAPLVFNIVLLGERRGGRAKGSYIEPRGGGAKGSYIEP
jgi:hypothetical protein